MNCNKTAENGRIAFLLSNLSTGGAERAVSNLSKCLEKEYEVNIILNDDEDICFDYGGEIISLGLKRPATLMTYGYQLRALLKRLLFLRKCKKEGRYKAYISFMDSSNLANMLTGSKTGKVIVSIRGSMEQHNDRKIYRLLVKPVLKRLYGKTDRIVAVSHELREQLIQSYGVNREKAVTISNGYDVEMIRALSGETLTEEEIKWTTEGFVIATMGRLCEEKAQWHLIRTFFELSRRYADCRLLILGDGEERKYLQSLITERNLEGKVILCGARKNPFRIISKADLFVFPSVSEGFPNALAEAMCCGIPCIATDFKSGARELLMGDNDKNKVINGISFERYGVIVPCCDGKKRTWQEALSREEKILQESMEYFLENRDKCNAYGNAARERIAQLSIEKIAGQWKALLGDGNDT